MYKQKKLMQYPQTENSDGMVFRNRLISLLSHEMKGLFANIQWMINGLESGLMQPETMKNMLPELKSIADNNLTILQKTLNWVNLQGDAYQPIVSEIHISQLFNNLQDFFAKQLEDKKLKFLFKIEKTPLFLCDEILLNFALRNVLGKAIAIALPETEIMLEAAAGAESRLTLQIKTVTEPSKTEQFFGGDINFLTDKNVQFMFVKDVVDMLNGTVGAAFAANHLFVITIMLPK